MKTKTQPKKYSLVISLIWLCSTITGMILTTGSITQQILFFLGAVLLTISAFLSKQQMFFAMQIVASTGALLWLISIIPNLRIYIYMGLTTIGAITYILKNWFHKTDKFYIIGIISLSLLALWFATDPGVNILLFNILLASGGLFIAIYSSLEFFILKSRIAIIFMILNILFIIKPIIFIFQHV